MTISMYAVMSRYDLTRLLIGSEGTLGIITEVTLRLQKIPEASVVSSVQLYTACESEFPKRTVDFDFGSELLVVMLALYFFCSWNNS